MDLHCHRIIALLGRAFVAAGFAFSAPGCAEPWTESPSELIAEAIPVPKVTFDSKKDAAPVPPLPWKDRPIGQDRWRRTLIDPKQPDAPRKYRWHAVELESADGELLIEEQELAEAEASGDSKAVANAQLIRLRQGDITQPEAIERLAELAMRQSQTIQLRRAAADTLADAGPDGLAKALVLLDEQASLAGSGKSRYAAELHEELLRGVARHQPPTATEAYASALTNLSPEVRQAAAEAWSQAPASAIPERLFDLTMDTQPGVRRAAIQTLAAAKHPRAFEAASNAMHDPQFEVQLAGIAALGVIDHAEATETLRVAARAEGGAIRAAAVSALAVRGDTETVLAAAEDGESKVRIAVAGGLAHVKPQAGIQTARALFTDRSMAVRATAIAAVATWPLADCGPLLVTALNDKAVSTRQAATAALATHWPAAKEFRATATEAERTKQLAELLARFRGEMQAASPAAVAAVEPRTEKPAETKSNAASRDQIAEALRTIAFAATDTPQYQTALGHLQIPAEELEAALTQLTDEQGIVIPDAVYETLWRGTEFEDLLDWRTYSAHEKRQCASEIGLLLSQPPFRPLIVRRLIEFVLVENDPLLWQAGLSACQVQSDAHVRRFAAAALGHKDPAVRRRACEYFAKFPGEDAVAWLEPALADETSYVCAAAARAIARCGRPNSFDGLVALAAHSEADCRLAAGTTLAIYGEESGRAALERLAYDIDPTNRMRAASAMGEIADPEFTTTLIALLDDDMGVRKAALASLPLVTGHQVRVEAKEQTAQIAEWKRWSASRR